jgi:hypothetical protein
VVSPYGIYDVKLNKGYLVIGVSHDTSEFAIDSIKRWWFRRGRYDYPKATELLILADGGGSNSSRSWVFKEKLQEFSNQSGLEIRVAHYPPYTSKWNPIEHRVFPHVSRALEGIVLESHCQMRNLIEERAKTKTGLIVKASIIEKIYELGKRSANVVKESINIVFDIFLEKWNYTISPNPLL